MEKDTAKNVQKSAISAKGSHPIDTFLLRFGRVTSSGRFIPEIDGLRFIAIGTVILFHVVVNLAFKSPLHFTPPVEGNLIVGVARHGFRGVELFFIISGFILAYPFASHYRNGKPAVRLRDYFLRRVTRLEPPYIIAMVFFFFATIIVKHESAREVFPHLLASLAYLHNFIYQSENIINNVAWSLEIEVQFYILVPLMTSVFLIRRARIRRLVITGVCLLTITNEWLFIDESSWMYLTIIRFLHFFLMGFLLADFYLVDWKGSPARSYAWDVVSLLGWPFLFMMWNHPEISERFVPFGTSPFFATFLFPPIALSLYVAVFRGVFTNRVMTNLWITTIGGMCYTIYLFHNQLIGVIISVTKDLVPTEIYTLNLLLQAVVVLPLMLAVTSVLFLLIEKPCMRKDWPRRLAERVQLFAERIAH